MRTYPSSTAVETPPVSNRRQPLRQARANPMRGTTTSTQPVGSVNDPNNAAPKANSGFFPAITHFTDAITALPKEMTRNYTMLKEVDAKIYGPEELLHCLVAEVRKTPIPPHNPSATPQILQNATSSAGSVPELVKRRSATSIPIELPPNQHSELHEPNSADLPRRHLIRDLRNVINEMLGTLDEKNHVISTAMDELEKQLGRCDTSYPQIAKEISEEARFGSVNHWAYTAKAAEKKGTLAGERTRRETASNHQTANLATNHDVDGVAARSEARREALAARKNKNPPLDSDFDDAKLPAQNSGRKPSANLKTRKVTEPGQTVNGTGVGLGIANASSVPPPSKRRKIEKPSFGSAGTAFPMERAMSSVYAPSNGTLKTTTISPRETPVVEVAKKKGRATVPVNGSTRRRSERNARTVSDLC